MNSRQIGILKLLREKETLITINELAKQFGVGLRSIQNDLGTIDFELQKNHIHPLNHQGKTGISLKLSKEEQSILDKLLYGYDKQSCVLSPQERLELIYNIFLFRQGYITLSNLTEQLDVSRNTVLSDLKRLRNELKTLPILLDSSTRFGIRLSGDEKAIRGYAIERYMENVNAACLSDVKSYYKESLCNRFFQIKSFEETKLVYQALQDSLAVFSNLTGNSFLKIINSIELAIERIKRGSIVTVNPMQMESIYGTHEFIEMHRLVTRLSGELGIVFPLEETAFITFGLFGSDLMNKHPADTSENYAEIQVIVCNLIQKVADKLETDFPNDISLYNDLVYHIRPAIFRMKNNIRQRNSLIDEIHEKYQVVYDAVAGSIIFIEQMTNTHMSEDEIGFIALHFISIIEKQRRSAFITPNVLIVCDSGMGTSHLLATRLTALYDVNVVDIIAFYELENTLNKYSVDYIISTLNLQGYDTIVIKVNPFISEADEDQLDKYFRRQRRRITLDRDKFLQILEQECLIKDREGLLNKLTAEFSLIFHNNNRKEEELMLKDVISKNMIELDYDASDWEDAVRRAGKLLKDADCIDQDYIESMVNTVKTMGSYIVISKGIALPHSRSGEGARRIGICFLRLAKPVVFGHQENDPVDLLFGLSSTDNKSHLGALKDLVSFLTDESKIELLRRGSSVDEIYHYLIADGGEKKNGKNT